MGEKTKNNRNRNTALLLIGAGLFLLLDHVIGFFPILAVILILLGIYRLRSRRERRGYVFIGLGVIILFGHHMIIIFSAALISLGLYFIRSQKGEMDGTFTRKQKIVDSVRLGREPWILRNSSILYVIGETYIDLSLAILEQRETVLILQGVVGDVDIKAPDDIGVSVVSSVTLGQIQIVNEREAGLMNKLVWKSANYDHCEHRVKLVASYIIGNINIKIL